MNTRSLAGAFLKYNDEVLMMHRGLHKQLGPGMWAGIGGHIEPDVMADPLKACLREIREETGIDSDNISEIELKYITIGKTGDIIEMIYYYVGYLNQRCDLTDTNEGTLHWIKINDIKNLPMSKVMRHIFDRWIDYDDEYMMINIINDSESNWIKL